jgi:uncharacterized protein
MPSATKKRAAGPARRSAEVSLALDHAGELTVAVIADTHGRPHPDGVALVRAREPDAILHAGDIGDLGVLDAFEAVAPVTAVRGNIDERTHLPDDVTVDVRSADGADGSALRMHLTHIAVRGPRLRADAARRAHTAGASLVICGHSHVPFVGADRGLTVFNPGSIGPRRFHLPIVFGVLTIAGGRLSMRHVDCETGQTWAP